MAKRRIKKPVRKKKSDYPGEMSFRKALGMNPTYYQEGGNYNMQRASELGYTPDEAGHYPSVDSETGMWLKSKQHPTAWMEAMYGYQLNPEVYNNYNVTYNPEGYFGENQLQYVPKKKFGGKLHYQDAGKLPTLYVDPNDPAGRKRYKAYRDSLSLYNDAQSQIKYFRKLGINPREFKIPTKDVNPSINDVKGFHSEKDIKTLNRIKPLYYLAGSKNKNSDGVYETSLIPVFKKPTQPVENKPNPEVAPASAKQSNTVSKPYRNFARETITQVPYRNPKTGETETRMILSTPQHYYYMTPGQYSNLLPTDSIPQQGNFLYRTNRQNGGKLYYQEYIGKLPVKYVEDSNDPAFIAYKDSFDLAKLTDIQREREGAAKFISFSSMPQSGRDFRNAEKNNLGKNPNAPKGYYNDKDADYVTYNTARQSLNNPRIFISPRGSADIFHPSIDPTSVYFSSKGAANAYYPYPKQQVAIKPSGGTEGYTHQYTYTNPFTGKKEQRVVAKEKVGDQVISKYLNWDQYQKQKESKEYSNFLYQDKRPAIIPKQQGGKLYYQENTGQLPLSTGFNFSGYLDGNQGIIPDYNNIPTKSHISNILLNTPLPVVKPADKPKNKPKKSDVLDLDNSLDYLVNTRGGTRDLWGHMADTIGYHESAHTMDPLQKQIGGGPGRGIFQFEAPSLVTAQNRYKRIADKLKLKTDPEILSAKSALELSPEQQYSLFLINLSESKAKLKDYADNKLPLVDLWLQGHKNKEAKGDRESFRTSVQKAKKDSINSGYSTLKEFGGKLYYQQDIGDLPTTKYGTPEYEEAYRTGNLLVNGVKPLPEFKVTPEYKSLSDELRRAAIVGIKEAAELTGVPGAVRFARSPVQSLKGAGNTIVDLGLTVSPFANMNPSAGFQYAKQGTNPLTGEGSFRAEDVEGAFNTLDAAGLATIAGAGLKAPVQQGLKQTGKYLTQGPLRNAYKLRSSVLKENPEVFLYRAEPTNFDTRNTVKNLQEKLANNEGTAVQQARWKNYINEYNQGHPKLVAQNDFHGQWLEKDPARLDWYLHSGDKVDVGTPMSIFRTKIPTSQAAQYNVGNIKKANVVSASPETEFVMPRNIIEQGEKFPESSWQQLIQEDKAFNTPHWWRGYGSKTPKQLPGSSNAFKSEIDWAKWNKEIPENKALMQEYNAIEQQAKADGSWMKNPDGSAFQGTPEQFIQQQSSYFKKAFPDVLKDEVGNVQINYHGSPNKFNEFDETKFYSGDYGKGIYTSPDKKGILNSYANDTKSRVNRIREITGGEGNDANLYELYINSKNPKIFDDVSELPYDIKNYGKNIEDFPTRSELYNQYSKEVEANSWIKSDEDFDKFLSYMNKTPREKAQLTLSDNDFIRINDTRLKEQVIPFSNYPKSAVGNNGMFDMTNPNIYKALAPVMGIGAGAYGVNQIQNTQPTMRRFGGKLRYARGGSLTSAQDTAQAADLNKDVVRKDIKKASVGEDFGAAAYGVFGGLASALTFGLTDDLTDAGFKALQAGAGHDVNSDEAKRQAGIKGWGNVAGAVTGAIINPGAIGSAAEEGLEGIGTGIEGIDPSSDIATGIGTSLKGMAGSKVLGGLNDKDKIPEGMQGFSKLFMARNGGRFRYGYRGGGHMLSQNMGLTEIDGPSHEQGGVTLPNSGGRPDVEVEGPETIYTPENYVMSEKMKASKEALEYAGITGKAASRLAGKSYADLSKAIKSKAGDKLRPADPLSKKMLDKEMKRLMMAHEYDREAKRMKDEAMRSQMMGGSNVVAETPEERAGGYNMYPNAESIAFPGNGATSVVPTNNNDPIMVTGADGSQQMLTDEPIETEAPFIEQKMAQGGKMIKRADGSYSKRGLWDNIRANRGSGRKPTKQMLEQEAKIKAAEKAYGGYYADGGSFDNPGFRALPDYVQAKIKSNMALGGFMGDYIDEDDTMEYGEGGYTVRKSNDRKGKTHVVTGPDGTKKYFGDPNLGERGKSKYGKDAFYARHKKNLAKNPYFRAYARATWEDGGYMNMLDSNVDMVDMETPMYEYGGSMMYGQGGGIHIDPSKRGTFKAQASRMGMGVQQAASTILNAPEGKYSPAMRKKANFARNFAKADGGYMYQMGGEMMAQQPQGGGGQEEIMQQVAQMLQQGMAPEEIVGQLVKMGLPQEQAIQIVQMIVQQMQGQQQAPQEAPQQAPPMMRGGGYMYQMGGEMAPQQAPQQGGSQEQIMQAIVEMLQQGLQPEQIVGELVKMGIPQEAAIQAVQMVMQQVQQSQGMQQQQAAPPFEQGMMSQQGAPATMRGGGRMYQMGGSLADTYLQNLNKPKALFRNGGKLYYQEKKGLLPDKGYAAINQFENTMGTYDAQGNPIGMGRGDQYAQTEDKEKIEAFIDSSIGRDTWDRLPDDVKTQAYSFMFNTGKYDAALSGLAQAIDNSTGGGDLGNERRGYTKDFSVDAIKGADFSNPYFYDNYLNVLGDQYNSIADNTSKFNTGVGVNYAPTLRNRAISIHNNLYPATSSTLAQSATVVPQAAAAPSNNQSKPGTGVTLNPTQIALRNFNQARPSSTPSSTSAGKPEKYQQWQPNTAPIVAGGLSAGITPIANLVASITGRDTRAAAPLKFEKPDYTPVAIQRAAANQALANTREALRRGSPTQGNYLSNLTVTAPSLAANVGREIANKRFEIGKSRAEIDMREQVSNDQNRKFNIMNQARDQAAREQLRLEAARGFSTIGQGVTKDLGETLYEADILRNLETRDFSPFNYIRDEKGRFKQVLSPRGAALYRDNTTNNQIVTDNQGNEYMILPGGKIQLIQ